MTDKVTMDTEPAGPTVDVDHNEKTVCCRGGSQSLGHPAVYLSFQEKPLVQCYYCGREFKRAPAEPE